MKLRILSPNSTVIINQDSIFQLKINSEYITMYYAGGTVLFKFKNKSDFDLFSNNILESSIVIETTFIYTSDPKDRSYDIECAKIEIL